MFCDLETLSCFTNLIRLSIVGCGGGGGSGGGGGGGGGGKGLGRVGISVVGGG